MGAGAVLPLLLLAAAAAAAAGGWGGAGTGGARAQEVAAPPAPPAATAAGAETALKARLLEGYDRTTYPFSEMWEARGETGDNRTGVDVKVGINFHRVLSVSEVSSEVELMVWLRQVWTDPRLSWNATETGVEKLYFFVDAGFGASEASQIWVRPRSPFVPAPTSLASAPSSIG